MVVKIERLVKELSDTYERAIIDRLKEERDNNYVHNYVTPIPLPSESTNSSVTSQTNLNAEKILSEIQKLFSAWGEEDKTAFSYCAIMQANYTIKRRLSRIVWSKLF